MFEQTRGSTLSTILECTSAVIAKMFAISFDSMVMSRGFCEDRRLD